LISTRGLELQTRVAERRRLAVKVRYRARRTWPLSRAPAFRFDSVEKLADISFGEIFGGPRTINRWAIVDSGPF
jgi:hypothetical protein